MINDEPWTFDNLPVDVLSHYLFPSMGMRSLLLAAAVSQTWASAAGKALELWRLLEFESSYRLDGAPCFLAALPTGEIVSTEASANAALIRLLTLDAMTQSAKRIGGRNFSDALRVLRPTGVAVDVSSDELFVACSESRSVQRYCLSSGRVVGRPWHGHAVTGAAVDQVWPGSFGPLPGHWQPYGLALTHDPCGTRLLFVADSKWHRIVVLRGCGASGGLTPADDEAGFTLHASWGCHGEEPGQFDHPRGVAIEHGEHGMRVWVCDRGNDRLQCFTPDGVLVKCLGGSGRAPGCFLGPYDLTFVDRRLIVSEFEGRRVQVLTPDGAPLQVLHLADDGFVDGWSHHGSPCPTGVVAHGQRVYVAQFSGAPKLHVYRVAGPPCRMQPARHSARCGEE